MDLWKQRTEDLEVDFDDEEEMEVKEEGKTALVEAEDEAMMNIEKMVMALLALFS